MKTNYPESKTSKIPVRIVKVNKQLPILNTENIIDTRPSKQGSFGGTFFLNLTDNKVTEKQAWQKLNKRFHKRLRDL